MTQSFETLSEKSEKPVEFTQQDYQGLSSLGYMYMRMGKNDEAEKIFKGILKLATNDRQKNWLYKNLSVVYLRKKEYKMALECLRFVMDNRIIKSDEAYLYLLKAEALWQSSRQSEAENTIKQYYNLIS